MKTANLTMDVMKLSLICVSDCIRQAVAAIASSHKPHGFSLTDARIIIRVLQDSKKNKHLRPVIIVQAATEMI